MQPDRSVDLISDTREQSKADIKVETAPGFKFMTPEDTKVVVREELQKEGNELRKDLLVIFGLFAGLLTFTVTQVQTLLEAKRTASAVGASSFLLGAFLTLVLCQHHIQKDKTNWKEFLRPTFIAILLLFFFSFECFWYTSHNEFWLPLHFLAVTLEILAIGLIIFILIQITRSLKK